MRVLVAEKIGASGVALLREHFDVDEGVGKPSRWNTLRALRVLRWAGRLDAAELDASSPVSAGADGR